MRTAAALESETRRHQMRAELRWQAFSFAMLCTGGDVEKSISLAKQAEAP